MTSRAIRLRAFFSTKGGVGKSSLAVACAKLLAGLNRRVVLVDADVTGTSLADGLDLCAPDVAPHPEGGYDLTVLPAGHLTLERTNAARNARATQMFLLGDEHAPRPAPPYLNDVLAYPLATDPEVKLRAALWRHVREDGVFYLPSSPTVTDLALASRWLAEEGRDLWSRQMAWVIYHLAAEIEGLDDIVFDLSPGTTGLVHDLLELCNGLAVPLTGGLPEGYPPFEPLDVRWSFDPVLVTSQDRNDLRVAVEWYARNRAAVPALRLVANRLSGSVNEVRDETRRILGDLGLQGAPRVDDVGLLSASLGQIFRREHDLALTDDVKALKAVLNAR